MLQKKSEDTQSVISNKTHTTLEKELIEYMRTTTESITNLQAEMICKAMLFALQNPVKAASMLTVKGYMSMDDFLHARF